MRKAVTFEENVEENTLVTKVTLLFVVALFVLSVFQSSALLTLAYDLPAGGWTENIIQVAEGWHTWMERCGATRITEIISEFVEHIHGLPIRD